MIPCNGCSIRLRTANCSEVLGCILTPYSRATCGLACRISGDLGGRVVKLVFAFVLVVLAQTGPDQVAVLGSAVVPLAQLPFSILVTLIGVLMVAVPALYYESGEVVSIGAAVQLLSRGFWRYLLAGVLFSVVMALGFLWCILPGIAVALVTPVFVNLIFVTDMSIGDAFS